MGKLRVMMSRAVVHDTGEDIDFGKQISSSQCAGISLGILYWV